MANFTRNWSDGVPVGTEQASDLDTFIQNVRGDISDRIKSMVYGFTAGENDGLPGFKKIIFKQQSSAPGTPNADEITLYSIDDGSNCGLFAKQEDGYTKQILKKVGTDINFVIEAADIPADVIDSQHYAAGSIDAEHLAADIIDETKIADDAIDSEHYNDGSIDLAHLSAGLKHTPTSYANEESVTFPNGLIEKNGYSAASGTEVAISFAVAFPDTIKTVQITTVYSAGDLSSYGAKNGTVATSGFTAITDLTTNLVGFYWKAKGY